MWSDFIIHKNKVCINDISEQRHMEEDHMLAIAISNNSTSFENLELSPKVQHNTSLDEHARTTVTVSFPDCRWIKTFAPFFINID